jgi:hypothetical protein
VAAHDHLHWNWNLRIADESAQMGVEKGAVVEAYLSEHKGWRDPFSLHPNCGVRQENPFVGEGYIEYGRATARMTYGPSWPRRRATSRTPRADERP